MKSKKVLELVIVFFVVLVTSITIFYYTVFFLGSKEDYLEILSKSSLSFILGRTLINIIAGLLLLPVFTVSIYLVNQLVPKTDQYSMKKLIKNYIALVTILSIISVLIVHVIL